MKQKTKPIVSLAVSTLGVVCLGVGMAKPVAANATTETAWLENGASVRYVGDGNGLRFTMQIAESAFDENATYGILIAPEDYLTAGKELTGENVFGKNAIYNWAVKTEEGWVYTEEEGKTQIVNLVTSEFNSNTVNGVAVKEFYGSLTDLLDGTYDEVTNPSSVNNIGREFRGVGYIRTGTEGAYDYTFVGDEDNVRSMAYVAQKAIEDTSKDAPTSTQKEKLQINYVNKITEQKATYTEEYYFEQADGSFEKAEALTKVNSSYNGAETTVDDEVAIATGEFAGYALDENNEKAVLSGKVYANDRLVLKAYYKRIALETIQGEARMVEVEDETFDLKTLLTATESEKFDQYAAWGDVTWKLSGEELDGSVVDFSVTEKRLYKVTASVGDDVIYTAEIDFYNPNEFLWNNEIKTEYLTLKQGKNTSVSVVTDPMGAIGDYYKLSVTGSPQLIYEPLHTKEYYEAFYGQNIVFEIKYYLDTTSNETNITFCGYTGGKQRAGSTWNTEELALDMVIDKWDLIVGSETGWEGSFMQINTSLTDVDLYVNFSVKVTADRVADTTERLIDVTGQESYELANVLKAAGVDETVYSGKDVAWTLNPVTAGNEIVSENGVADFTKVEKRAYNASASLSVYGLNAEIYTGVVDFYVTDELPVWTMGVNADDLVIKLNMAGVSKDVAVDPFGKTGTYYKITTESAQYHSYVTPAHTAAYYQSLQGEGLTLNFQVYVDATTSTDTLMAFGVNSLTHVMGSKWYDCSIPLDTLITNWTKVFNERRTNDWADAMAMTRDATSTTFYIGNFEFEVDVPADAVVETTPRLIDVNGTQSYEMSNVLTAAGVESAQELVWTLIPVYGGETVTLEGGVADFTKVEKRAYNAVAAVEKFGVNAPIYKGVLDFYDSTEGFVWNQITTVNDIWARTGTSWTLRTSETSKEGAEFAEVVDLTIEGHTGSYYRLSNLMAETDDEALSVHSYALPWHTKAYYENYRTYNFTYEIYAANNRWSHTWNSYPSQDDYVIVGGTWDTVTISMASVLDEQWGKVLGTESAAGQYGLNSPMFSLTATKTTFWYYVGGFNIVEA